ncbi:hypothetical protein [Erwinia sp. MYb416]|uniref:hypothetical protein n=1 Tax=Erwinia sp. MYb416 TaxID=3108532 RepID=UPI0030B55B04
MDTQQDISFYLESQAKRFRKHLDPKLDITSLVLKGHLFAEEQLFEIITLHCRNTMPLQRIQLSFSQKLKLASAMYSFHLPVDLSNNKLWSALEHLNKLRNTLAHSLDNPETNKKIIVFLNSIRDLSFSSVSGSCNEILDLDDKELLLKLFNSISGLLGYLSCMRGIAYLNTPEKLYRRANIDNSDFVVILPDKIS